MNSNFRSELTLVLGDPAGDDEISRFGTMEKPQEGPQAASELAERRGLTLTERRHRKKMVERMQPMRVQHTPRGVAKASKMSIIAVHGNALDKIGFEICERANRSADLRLEKVISTYDILEAKNNIRLQREQAEMKDSLVKIRKVRRTDDNGTEARYMSFPPKHLKLPPVEDVRASRLGTPAGRRSQERKVDMTPVRLPDEEPQTAETYTPRCPQIQVKDGFLTAYADIPAPEPTVQHISSSRLSGQIPVRQNNRDSDSEAVPKLNGLTGKQMTQTPGYPVSRSGNILAVHGTPVLSDFPDSHQFPANESSVDTSTSPKLPVVMVTYSSERDMQHGEENGEKSRDSSTGPLSSRNVLNCPQLTIPYDQKLLNHSILRHVGESVGYHTADQRMFSAKASSSAQSGATSHKANQRKRSDEQEELRAENAAICGASSLTLPPLPQNQTVTVKNQQDIRAESEANSTITLFPQITTSDTNPEASRKGATRVTWASRKAKIGNNSPKIKTHDIKQKEEKELLMTLYKHKRDLQSRIEDFLSEDFESV